MHVNLSTPLRLRRFNEQPSRVVEVSLLFSRSKMPLSCAFNPRGGAGTVVFVTSRRSGCQEQRPLTGTMHAGSHHRLLGRALSMVKRANLMRHERGDQQRHE
jgi:hypothetical protein